MIRRRRGHDVARRLPAARRKRSARHGPGPTTIRPSFRQGPQTHALACLIGLAALALFPGLGGSARLTLPRGVRRAGVARNA